jgi:hypothetical protein
MLLSESCVLVSMGALSDERTGLQFVVQSMVPSHTEPVTILYCLIRDSPNLEDQVTVSVSPRNREAQLYPPSIGFPLCHLLRLAWLLSRYSNLPRTWRARSPYIRNRMVQSKIKIHSHYDRWPVNQYVLVPSPRDRRVPSEQISILHQEVYIKAKLPLGGLHVVACSATWNLGTNSAFALWQRKTLIELAGRRTFRMQTDF